MMTTTMPTALPHFTKRMSKLAKLQVAVENLEDAIETLQLDGADKAAIKPYRTNLRIAKREITAIRRKGAQ